MHQSFKALPGQCLRSWGRSGTMLLLHYRSGDLQQSGAIRRIGVQVLVHLCLVWCSGAGVLPASPLPGATKTLRSYIPARLETATQCRLQLHYAAAESRLGSLELLFLLCKCQVLQRLVRSYITWQHCRYIAAVQLYTCGWAGQYPGQ